MKYMGSKRRIAKFILPIILKDREKDQLYIEPFVGGGNLIEKVKGRRIGSDICPYTIEALRFIRDEPNNLPEIITEDYYNELKSKKEINGITGFVGISMSFGAKLFGGYARNKKGSKGCIENMKTQTRRVKKAALKQSPLLQGVQLVKRSYNDLKHLVDFEHEKCIIYCDPPYKGTTSYKNKFNHEEFWQWCRDKTLQGHKVFISEYQAPDDFECIWSKEITTTLNAKSTFSKVEKLFIYKK